LSFLPVYWQLVIPPTKSRRRFGRTFSRSRWREYRDLLVHAQREGYEIVSLDDFVPDGRPAADRVLILRHDVDQAARSVMPMLAIEQDLGLRATWYFRWRTARPSVVAAVRAAGGSVGLHYETLTRHTLTRGDTADAADREAAVTACRDLLRAEIRAFRERFGSIESIAAHGDTRVPHVNNGDLVADRSMGDLEDAVDANIAMRSHDLGCWLTDRSSADGRWRDGLDPIALLNDGVSPILCLTHPNNWTSGLHLWAARLAHAARREGDRPPL
jgi:hypothetical protein